MDKEISALWMEIPAAERYTEARLSKPAHMLIEDIDKETVEFQPNYDDTLTEPKVLPHVFLTF